MLVWGIAIVSAMLLLSAMGKLDLVALGKSLGGSESFGNRSYQGAGGPWLDKVVSGQADVAYSGKDAFRGRRAGFSGRENNDADQVDGVYAQGGYGDYRGSVFDSVDRDPVDIAAAKALAADNAKEAAADLWARFGGENACDLPVSSVAFAEAMSLVAANGDVPCGGTDFAADLGATPDKVAV
jgi:hypothetical protein